MPAADDQRGDLGDAGRQSTKEEAALNPCGRAAYVSAPSWTRTKNLLIKSQLLCQLS